ncbi:Cyclin-dependent kinases regulatory subunit 2 [Perkinsus olseni]|uniref:Cyclin-dependent kinases regulatory subunit 2 n=2 Tax=Perkinsus olseni TaxID=32597 RepID=A0A7J6NMM8_PEROL|nr:Cyclin-dependent kinases regulatory subunit 2 [Perkinsus olseni]
MSVTIKTNLGDMKAELFCSEVPNASKNFLALAASGYYDGTKFHRLMPGFMVQGGDPTGTGKGGENWEGGKQADEFVSSVKHDRRGILSFANNGPDTIGSQFFITFGRQPHLNGVYTVFGRLIDGMDTLMKIEQVPVGKKHRPTQDIVIEEIVIHANPIADQEAGAEGYARFSALFCPMGRSRSRSRDEERHRHHRRRSRSGDRHRHRSYERRPRSYGDDERRSRRREDDDDRDYHRHRGSSDRRGGRGWKEEEVEEKKDSLRATKREKSEEKEEKKEEKEKPNFEVSGLLAEEQNSKNGIALMFSQPADAAMPTDAWRLYENRDEAQNGDGDKILHIHRKSCYLFGKDRRLTDCNDEAPLCFIPIDHPTCSRQHAVIQFRLVGDVTKPYLLDLGGKNGTFVNEKRVPAAKYYELREGDLIKFAHSSKSYVLLSAGPLKNKDDKKEADEDGEIDFDVLEDSPQLETSRGTMLG